MNDYVSKPVDEKILYSKIVTQLKKTEQSQDQLNQSLDEGKKMIDMTFLRHLTKGNPDLIIKMLDLYLEQTPVLISELKTNLKSTSWDLIQSAAHRLIPSFAIIGLDHQYEELAVKVQEYATAQQNLEQIRELVEKLDVVCALACRECEEEILRLNQKRE
jgi:HPt (histidine-containing phosphotransfer) domain-containing protein